MTQDMNSTLNIQDAETATITNAEIRAENIDGAFQVDEKTRNSYVPSIPEKFNEITSNFVEVKEEQYIPSETEVYTDDNFDLDVIENSTKLKVQVENTEYDNKVEDMATARDAVKELTTEPTHKLVIKRLQKAGVPFYSNSNISAYISNEEREQLIDEATEAYAKFMDCLAIDRVNDPNAIDTPRRVAKMYINEHFSGRYFPAPKATAFPNQHTGKDTGFTGLLVTKVEFTSLCSHHHENVVGHMWIGIICSDTVIGLSKYSRLATWCANRGSLQEELAEDVARTIQEYTGSADIGVMIEAKHFCCQARGLKSHDSTTQTTVLKGQFMTDSTLRKEFHDNIMFQKLNKN